MRKQDMEKNYKILATMHDRVPYWLVFDGMEIVGKFSNNKMATEWVKEQITLDKQAQNA